MNFSTVPPCDSTIARIRSKYRARSDRSASGSTDSPSAVEPATSQKTTVTVFRCSRGESAASVAPHESQNLALTRFSEPHDPHLVIGVRLLEAG